MKTLIVIASIFFFGCSSRLPERRPSNTSGMMGEFNPRALDELPADEPPADDLEEYEDSPPTCTETEQDDEVVVEEPCEVVEEPEEDQEPEYIPDSCFSYLDCPNHEACDVVSSRCFLCTEGWHCNNQYDLQRTGPSFCCTVEHAENQRCNLVGICQE
jgi:hypothetical protein